MGPIKIGVDLGQKHDYSAIVVAELVEERKDNYEVRSMQRLPLNTPYPQVAHRLIEVRDKVRSKANSKNGPEILVDATGLGQPVVDMIQQNGVSVTSVLLTGGEKAVLKEGSWHIAKSALVCRLQVLLQDRRLKFSKHHPLAEAMIDELLNFEIKVSQGGQDTYGAFKTGAHDDLVVALGLACWRLWRPSRSCVDVYCPGWRERISASRKTALQPTVQKTKETPSGGLTREERLVEFRKAIT